MAGVFRTGEIEWKGETYEITPTMALLRSIELQGVSIVIAMNEVNMGRPQMSVMSLIMAMLLRSGGAAVTDEEIYNEFQSGDTQSVIDLYRKIAELISPAPTDPKKPEAPASK